MQVDLTQEGHYANEQAEQQAEQRMMQYLAVAQGAGGRGSILHGAPSCMGLHPAWGSIQGLHPASIRGGGPPS